MSDTTTLVSENTELKSQISAERTAHDELIKELRSYQEVTKEEIALLNTQNAILRQTNNTLSQKVKNADRRSIILTILGLGIGFGVGCIR